MEQCVRCGHALGVGRFCLNCGHRVGDPVQPVLLDPPDQPVAAPPPPARAPARAHRGPGQARAWIGWIVALVLLALAAAFGVGLLTADPAPRSAPATAPLARGTPPSASPTAQSSSAPPAASPSAEPVDVARFAAVEVPATAPPNQDLSGNLVRYEAGNLLDGVPTTCWRMAGDGTGEILTFDLPEPTTLSVVGLVNGYAKSARDSSGRGLDWYRGNRRVLRVQWLFDDGSSVTQDLTEDRSLQQLEIDPVTTSRVRLRLLEVSSPGAGRASRDYTAISDVALVGSPG